jgi:hypothetical protein
VTTTFYKIMNTDTGKFSTGGQRPQWADLGKVWSTMGHLRAHLTMSCFGWRGGLDLPRIYEGGRAVIVECETVVRNETPVLDDIKRTQQKKGQEEDERLKREQREQDRREKKQLERLLKKHGRP